MADLWSALSAGTRKPFTVHAENLTTERVIAKDPDKAVEAASTIKLLVLLCLLRKVQDGRMSLTDSEFILPADATAHGSGILQYGYRNRPFEIYNLALFMMALSDNHATNALIRLLDGKEVINSYAKEIGLLRTRLLMERLEFETSHEIGITTPRDMTLLLRQLVQGRLLDQEHTAIALSMLEAVQGSQFARRINLAPLTRYGSKVGWLYPPSPQKMVLNECGFWVKDGLTGVFAIFSAYPLDPNLPYNLDSIGRRYFAKVAAAIFNEIS